MALPSGLVARRYWAVACAATFAAMLLVAGRGVGAAASIEGGRVVFRGRPVSVGGAMYYQPRAYHQYFWEEWTRGGLLRDLARARDCGFNTFAFQVNWGSFVSRVDPTTGRSEWNERALADLRWALRHLSAAGMLAVLWSGTARAPEGVGANYNAAWGDARGRQHGPYYGYLMRDWPAIAAEDSPIWRAMLEFHRRLAETCAEYDNVLYDPLDWQHLNINTWSFADAGNLRVWRQWLRARNPDLQHWNQRWGESNASWEEVLFPVDGWVETTVALLGPPYEGRARDPYEGPKWADFREWDNALCDKVNAAIVRAIRGGDTDAVIGQRVDPWRFGDWRQQTWAPPGVDFICQGTYPEKVEQIAPDTVRREIRVVRERAPRQLPILFWEVGVSQAMLGGGEAAPDFESLQAKWFDCVESVAREEHLLGFCWWVWRDYYMSEASLTFGLLDVEGRPKAAVACGAAARLF